jgi:alkylation response protein AidB-like acyl-CoA dehydrogenase
MDFNLTDEQKLIQQTAHEFANTHIEPIAFQIDRENEIPPEILTGLGELGILGLCYPEAYGGSGAGFLAFVLANEQIAKASSGVGMVCSVNNLGMSAIYNRGTEEQKKQWMPACCAGAHMASFAFTEPNTGSDPKMLATAVTRQGDKYILNGCKRFISLADYKGPMIVFAADAEAENPSAFIVDKFCPGYQLDESWDKIGNRGCHAYDVYFKDVELTADQLLGKRGEGFNILLENIAYGKMGMSAEALGHAQEALDLSIKYAREKTNRDKPIARFESMQMRIAAMGIKVEAMRWLTYHLGFQADQKSRRFAVEAAMTKEYMAEALVDVAREAVQAHGSYGVMRDFKVEMIFRDAIICEIIEGTKDLQRRIAAGYLLR